MATLSLKRMGKNQNTMLVQDIKWKKCKFQKKRNSMMPFLVKKKRENTKICGTTLSGDADVQEEIKRTP